MMTHSTRRSYKDKYEAAKRNVVRTDNAVEDLAATAEFITLLEYQRSEQHKRLQNLADAVAELIRVLDDPTNQFQFKFKEMMKPIDKQLRSYDGNLIIKRATDIVKYASDRIAIAGELESENREKIHSLLTGSLLLQGPVSRAQKGYLESYQIGIDPTDKEIIEAHERKSHNPRTLDFDYETDYDSDSSEESSREASKDIASAITVRSAVPKHSTRKANESNHDVAFT